MFPLVPNATLGFIPSFIYLFLQKLILILIINFVFLLYQSHFMSPLVPNATLGFIPSYIYLFLQISPEFRRGLAIPRLQRHVGLLPEDASNKTFLHNIQTIFLLNKF